MPMVIFPLHDNLSTGLGYSSNLMNTNQNMIYHNYSTTPFLLTGMSASNGNTQITSIPIEKPVITSSNNMYGINNVTNNIAQHSNPSNAELEVSCNESMYFAYGA